MAKKSSCATAGCGCAAALTAGLVAIVVLALMSTPMPMPNQVSDKPDASATPERKPESPKASNSKVIPGLQPVDIYLNFTNKGFTKRGPNQIENAMGEGTVVGFECKSTDGSMNIQIWGPSASTVSSVQASITSIDANQTNQLANEFFGYLATLPYDNADPQKAALWVRNNVDRNARTTIGGITFEIFANVPNARILSIKK